MCTISIIKNHASDEVIITFNRDEQRTRLESKYLNKNLSYCYPVDLETKGTWIGANAKGLTFALLNRYQDKSKIDAKISRGLIIPKLLECNNTIDVIKNISNLKLSQLNPFDLIMVNLNEIWKFSFDGAVLKKSSHNLDEHFFWSSSSVDTKNIINYRKSIFKEFVSNSHNLNKDDIFNNLHKKITDNNPSSAIFMSRDITHTKSIVQIVISNKLAQIKYDKLDNNQDDNHQLNLS